MDDMPACHKQVFVSRREALAALRSTTAARHKKPDRALRVYRCPVCRLWHWTGQERRAFQRERKQRRQQQAQRRALEALIYGE